MRSIEKINELDEENADLRAKLASAINRMDRARNVLTGGTPTLECNWGLLDTEDLRALKEQEKG